MPLSRRLADASRWRHPFTVYQSAVGDVDVDMDVDVAVAAVVGSGADAWILNAGGIRSWYPTDLPFQTVSPHLPRRASGDLFGEAVSAARAAGVSVIARLDMSKVPARVASEHPDWLYRSPTGQPQVVQGLFSACPSGAYYQERTLDVIDEILARYDVAGFFFNYFTFNESDYEGALHPPCHCDRCRESFAASTEGAQLPISFGADGIEAWRRFTAGVLARLTARIVDHVAARHPDAAVIIRRGAPIEYVEATNGARADRDGFWPFATAETVGAHVASRPDAPILVGCLAFPDTSYRMAAENSGHFARSVAQTIARGGAPAAYAFGSPGRVGLDDVLEPGYELMRMRSRNADVYAALRPGASVVLVQPGAAAGGDAKEEFRGWWQALSEEHLPFDICPVGALPVTVGQDAPDAPSVIVLPDLGALEPGILRALDGAVAEGATVIATGASGAGADGTGQLRGSPRLRPTAPAMVARDLRGTYASCTASEISDAGSGDATSLLPVSGRYHPFAWGADGDRRGRVLTGSPAGPPELIGVGDRDVGPAHVVTRVGGGRLVEVPWTVGVAFRRLQSDQVRTYMAGLVARADRPLVRIEAHEAVEAVVGRSGERIVVHLLNHSGLGRRRYGQPAPVGRVTLSITGLAGARAEELRSGRVLVVEDVGDDAVIELDDVDVLDVVVVHPRSSTRESSDVDDNR